LRQGDKNLLELTVATGLRNTVETLTTGEVSSRIRPIMNAITTLTPQQLRNAADLQERIQSLKQELNHLLGANSEPVEAALAWRRKLSAKGLANIRAGAKRQWASRKSENGSSSKGPQRSGKMSAAGRKRIAAALKARWAAAKRAGRNAL
jgi:hypothetical protein